METHCFILHLHMFETYKVNPVMNNFRVPKPDMDPHNRNRSITAYTVKNDSIFKEICSL